MALIQCTDCGTDISDQAPTCPSCGRPSPRTSEPRASVGAPVVGLIGGGMLAISPFLPWLTLGMISASGLQKTNNEALLLVAAGAIAAIAAIISLAQRKPFPRWVPLVTGLGSGVLTWVYMTAVKEQIAGMSFGNPQLGDGIYLSFAGAVLLLLAGVLPAYASSVDPEAQSSTPAAGAASVRSE